jgi:hypothetical protein
MKFQLPVPYIWSLYIVSTVLTLSSQFAVVDHLFVNFEWWGVQIGLGFVSLYAVLTARQLYTHGRTWPKRALLLVFPLSFLHLLPDVPIPYGVGLFVATLFFWWAAYRLSGRLAAVSPYGGPSGYL